MAEFTFQEAVHRLQSCEAMKEQVRNQLLLGENLKPAVPKINPNRVTVEYLQEPIEELARVVDEMEEILIDHGAPGGEPVEGPQTLTGKADAIKWYWSGVDDLERLKGRVRFYQDALDYADTLPAEQQRQFLAEFVFTPVFFGSRHKNVEDAESPWIYTVADFCEPARIYKNWIYAHELDDSVTGTFVRDIGESVTWYFSGLQEFADRVARGAGRVIEAGKEAVETIGRNIKPIGIGVGVLLLGVAGVLAYQNFKKG